MNQISLISIGAILLCVLCACKSSSSISDNKYVKAEARKEICDAVPVNISAIRDSVARSNEVKTLQEAGVPCRVVVVISLDSNGKYLHHTFAEKCHPLAVKAVERYVKQITFVLKSEVGMQSTCEVTTYFSWNTW
jgi:hypothetical protein